MTEVSGRYIIQSLQKRWNRQLLVAYLLFAAGIIISTSVITFKIAGINWLSLPLLFITIAAIGYFFIIKKISEQDIIRFLNNHLISLQESAHLLLQPTEALNGLERLQVKKISHLLTNNIPAPQLIRNKIKASLLVLSAGLVISIILLFLPFQPVHSSPEYHYANHTVYTSKPETKPAAIKTVTIRIVPPLYTGNKTRIQNVFNLAAEQKATVTWNITTSQPAGKVELIFNNNSILEATPFNKEHIQWTISKTIMQPGFYQAKIDNEVSELYQLQMVKDEAPTITVLSPKQNTMLQAGEPKNVVVNIALADDYGIATTSVHATTASGSGEAVKFKETEFAFPLFKSGSRKYRLQKTIDLNALDMQAGDELYFYVKATDNNNQEKRSDVYVVRLEDTTQLMSMEGLISGLDVKPELFRSERQIIIETEQLLKDKDTMSAEDFNKKSSDLGIDQKLLHLRYSKFLGEESESEVAEAKDNNAENDAADFGNAAKIIDQFSDKHDNAEDATFFDDATKKQLKAMLNEMWKAELQLRTYKPKAALPFEYTALRLLKDLQQQTRSYVAKTGVKTTPLNPGKRLSGKLGTIIQPVTNENTVQKDSSVIILRRAIGILEKVKNGEAPDRNEIAVLTNAGTQLSVKAASNPAAYLPAYQAVRRILENKKTNNDVQLAGHTFQQLVQAVYSTPQQRQKSPDNNLSQRYFMNLNRGHE